MMMTDFGRGYRATLGAVVALVAILATGLLVLAVSGRLLLWRDTLDAD